MARIRTAPCFLPTTIAFWPARPSTRATLVSVLNQLIGTSVRTVPSESRGAALSKTLSPASTWAAAAVT
jgi:hypothetical protein